MTNQLSAFCGLSIRTSTPRKPASCSACTIASSGTKYGLAIQILLLAAWIAYSFFNQVSVADVSFYRYQKGFLHEKVMLIDDNVATVGTANFDNRSFRLNFEITAVVVDAELAGNVEQMFENDFASSRLMERDEYDNKPFWFKLAVRTARLAAPVL